MFLEDISRRLGGWGPERPERLHQDWRHRTNSNVPTDPNPTTRGRRSRRLWPSSFVCIRDFPHHAPPLPFLRQSPISLLPMVGWFDCFRSCLFLSIPLPCLSPLTSHALTLLSPPPFLFQSLHLLLPPLSTGLHLRNSLTDTMPPRVTPTSSPRSHLSASASAFVSRL